MTLCAICRKPVELMVHEFWVGTPAQTKMRPPDWKIAAPLYFLASDDGRSMRLPFCGPVCSSFSMDYVKWYVRENPVPPVNNSLVNARACA